MTKLVLSGLALSLVTTLAAAAVHGATLTTGTGDGSLTVTVTAFGSILRPATVGLPDDGFFDPFGDTEAATTVYESFIAAPNGTGRESFETLASRMVEVSQTETEYVTQFWVGPSDQFFLTLTQTVTDADGGSGGFGSTLSQSFEITNMGEVADSFDLIRFLDGDLNFVGGPADLAGRNSTGGSLFQIETDGGTGFPPPFIELFTGVAGLTTAVPGRNFQIAGASALRDSIMNGDDLDNTVEGDGNGDNVTDVATDWALAHQNFLTVQAGQTVRYGTTTIFGSTAPTAPGTDETVGLLPDSIGPDGGFVFEVDAEIFDDGDIVWIDPIIAVGYTYTITGAEFASVTAPSLGLVNDADGYVVTVGLDTFALLAGGTYTFEDGVTAFTITDIATGLALDPADLTAFATGISLRDIVARTIVITQTPITRDVPDVAPVPLPAGGVLLGAGLLGLLAMRRRRV